MFLAAIAATLVFHWSKNAETQWPSATSVPLLFGIAAIGWGYQELRAGKALIHRAPYMASRTERPLVFWTVILVFGFAIGLVLLAAFVWRVT